MTSLEFIQVKAKTRGLAALSEAERFVLVACQIIDLVKSNGMLFVFYHDFPTPIPPEFIIDAFAFGNCPEQAGAIRTAAGMLPRSCTHGPVAKRQQAIDALLKLQALDELFLPYNKVFYGEKGDQAKLKMEQSLIAK